MQECVNEEKDGRERKKKKQMMTAFSFVSCCVFCGDPAAAEHTLAGMMDDDE